MNIVFWVFILIAGFIIWCAMSKLFRAIGGFIMSMFEVVNDEIFRDETEEETNEN